MVVYTQVTKYVLAKMVDVGGIRSDADEVTQTFRIEKSLVYLFEDLMSTGECFAWDSHKGHLSDKETIQRPTPKWCSQQAEALRNP